MQRQKGLKQDFYLSLGLIVLVMAVFVAVPLPVMAETSSKQVVLFKKDTTDVTGTLKHLNAERYLLSTAKGDVSIPRKQYQGMVLDNVKERKIAETITTNVMVMIAAAQYNFALRQEIGKRLRVPESSCKRKSDPLAHFLIGRNGAPTQLKLLVSSACPGLDKALVTAIQGVPKKPLPKDYPFDVLPVNIYYPYKLPVKSK